jgi:hypothetical protein
MFCSHSDPEFFLLGRLVANYCVAFEQHFGRLSYLDIIKVGDI